MPVVIHRADPDADRAREAFPYDRIVGVIMMVIVGLWIVGDLVALIAFGSIEGLVVDLLPEAKEDFAEVHPEIAMALLKTFGFGSWYALCGIGIRNSRKWAMWMVFPASLGLVAVNQLPIDETLFAESVFALAAMGYCLWRLLGRFGPKPV